MFIDTHCHLDFPEFNSDRDAVIRRSKAGGIDYMVNVGSTLKSSKDSVELAQNYDFIYAAVGIHPHDAKEADAKALMEISELAKKDKVVAIGEIGLDYYRNLSPRERQIEVFQSLLKIAKELNLPVVIHSREAQIDVIKILKEAMPLSAVVHCFSGDENFLKQCLDLGSKVSFTCNITYKKAQNLRDIIALVPMEALLLETDCPYLSPEGLRGKRNEPLNVKYAAEEIARIKNLSIEEVGIITSRNAKGFFRIK